MGFKSIDLAIRSYHKSVQASITGNGLRVGKYFVNLTGYLFAGERLKNATSKELISCDEIGPMVRRIHRLRIS
jgi:nucleoside-triphosphatase